MTPIAAPLLRCVALGVLGSVLLAACQSATRTDAPAPSTAAPAGLPAPAPPLAATAHGLTARQRLTILAEGITATPADATTHLPYTYLHTRTWSRSSNAIARFDQRRWRSPDGTTLEITRRLPDLPGLAHEPTADDQELFHTAREHRTRYHDRRPSELDDVSPAALADALAPRQLAGEPAYPRLLATGVLDLAASRYLTRTQRAATLRVLATIPAITYQGESTDLAGRRALAFAVHADGTTTTLLIRPDTGELLAGHERAGTNLHVYRLILHRAHTPDTTTSSDPPPPAPAPATTLVPPSIH